jgi:uncharacterized protein YbaR (Trm112 family)
MHTSLLDVLRCPFCGTGLAVVENDALVGDGDDIEEGVLGCECCAYPVISGIPVLIADDTTRRAMHALEDGHRDDALFILLGHAEFSERQERLRSLMQSPDATYRDALALLCDDAEAACFLYRFTDPTFLTVEALLGAIAQARWPLAGRTLDLCGGSGHLTRVLSRLRTEGDALAAGTVLADVYFWKLWLARRFTVPEAAGVCCDANHPLPFARATFSTVLLADAFPYIWHKRMLADEMMRLAVPTGVVVMPHLHSALGENFSAGDTLTPASYQALFAPHEPRLFGDAGMFDDVIERRMVDLTRDVTPEALASEAALTLVASPRADLFRRREVPPSHSVSGELAVNPLYRVERGGGSSTLSLEFPTPEYAEEFGACRRYLPERITVESDLTRPIRPEALGAAYAELRNRRVLIDAPVGYC